MLFFWTFYSSKNPENNVSQFPHKYEAAQLFSTMIINKNKTKYWALNQHIKMISEGSCDTEDWRNDAEKSALLQRNKLLYIF